MIVFAELFDDDSGRWNPVRIDVRRDKQTGRTLVVDVAEADDVEGPSLRFTSDQAAKLLASIGEVLG